MATLDLGKTFWKTLKSVSVKEIARDAQRPFAIAIVGAPAQRDEVLDGLFPPTPALQINPDRSLIRQYDSLAPSSGFPTESGEFDLVITAGSDRENAPEGLHIYSISDFGSFETMVERILDDRPELRLALAARFPGLRPTVAQRIIHDTSLANAEFAMISALPGIVPILGALLPTGAIADIFVLTKNQAMMLYRLAAIYGLPLDASSRSRDLAPLLANAFGWRALARELVAVVPGGVGLVARGSIAYAGTAALGRGLDRLYATGSYPTRAQLGQYYRDALVTARDRVSALRKRLPGKRKAIKP